MLCTLLFLRCRVEDREAVGVLVNCPAYYRVSAPKAELLNKIKAMPADVSEEEEQVDVNEKKVKNGGLCSDLPQRQLRS